MLPLSPCWHVGQQPKRPLPAEIGSRCLWHKAPNTTRRMQDPSIHIIPCQQKVYFDQLWVPITSVLEVRHWRRLCDLKVPTFWHIALLKYRALSPCTQQVNRRHQKGAGWVTLGRTVFLLGVCGPSFAPPSNALTLTPSAWPLRFLMCHFQSTALSPDVCINKTAIKASGGFISCLTITSVKVWKR